MAESESINTEEQTYSDEPTNGFETFSNTEFSPDNSDQVTGSAITETISDDDEPNTTIENPLHEEPERPDITDSDPNNLTLPEGSPDTQKTDTAQNSTPNEKETTYSDTELSSEKPTSVDLQEVETKLKEIYNGFSFTITNAPLKCGKFYSEGSMTHYDAQGNETEDMRTQMLKNGDSEMLKSYDKKMEGLRNERFYIEAGPLENEFIYYVVAGDEFWSITFTIQPEVEESETVQVAENFENEENDNTTQQPSTTVSLDLFFNTSSFEPFTQLNVQENRTYLLQPETSNKLNTLQNNFLKPLFVSEENTPIQVEQSFLNYSSKTAAELNLSFFGISIAGATENLAPIIIKTPQVISEKFRTSKTKFTYNFFSNRRENSLTPLTTPQSHKTVVDKLTTITALDVAMKEGKKSKAAQVAEAIFIKPASEEIQILKRPDTSIEPTFQKGTIIENGHKTQKSPKETLFFGSLEESTYNEIQLATRTKEPGTRTFAPSKPLYKKTPKGKAKEFGDSSKETVATQVLGVDAPKGPNDQPPTPPLDRNAGIAVVFKKQEPYFLKPEPLHNLAEPILPVNDDGLDTHPQKDITKKIFPELALPKTNKISTFIEHVVAAPLANESSLFTGYNNNQFKKDLKETSAYEEASRVPEEFSFIEAFGVSIQPNNASVEKSHISEIAVLSPANLRVESREENLGISLVKTENQTDNATSNNQTLISKNTTTEERKTVTLPTLRIVPEKIEPPFTQQSNTLDSRKLFAKEPEKISRGNLSPRTTEPAKIPIRTVLYSQNQFRKSTSVPELRRSIIPSTPGQKAPTPLLARPLNLERSIQSGTQAGSGQNSVVSGDALPQTEQLAQRIFAKAE